MARKLSIKDAINEAIDQVLQGRAPARLVLRP